MTFLINQPLMVTEEFPDHEIGSIATWSWELHDLFEEDGRNPSAFLEPTKHVDVYEGQVWKLKDGTIVVVENHAKIIEAPFLTFRDYHTNWGTHAGRADLDELDFVLAMSVGKYRPDVKVGQVWKSSTGVEHTIVSVSDDNVQTRTSSGQFYQFNKRFLTILIHDVQTVAATEEKTYTLEQIESVLWYMHTVDDWRQTAVDRFLKVLTNLDTKEIDEYRKLYDSIESLVDKKHQIGIGLTNKSGLNT